MQRYAFIQIVFHWLSLLLIVSAYVAVNIGEYRLHFSLGALVFIVMFLRVGMSHMYMKKQRNMLNELPLWGQKFVKIMHHLLYAIFLLLPLLGMLNVYFSGGDWSIFGISMPMANSLWLSQQTGGIHVFLGNLGYFLIALHTIVAIINHYKYGTLVKMLPQRIK